MRIKRMFGGVGAVAKATPLRARMVKNPRIQGIFMGAA